MRPLATPVKRTVSHGEVAIVVAISMAALFFKLFLLYQRSLYIDTDEGYYLILAHNILGGWGLTLNGLPNIVFPPVLPLAIALLDFLLGKPQLSLMIITAVSGTLLGLLVYLIARKRWAFLPSIGCLVFTLFLNELNSFLPTSTDYTRILYRGSDILNCLLIFAAVYFAIRLMEHGRYSLAVLAAAFLALAYLTRPEAFLLFAAMLGLLCLLKWSSIISLSYKKLACFFFVFLMLSFPYLFYLKKVTGQWTLSGKISASQKYRTALLDVIEQEDWAEFNRIHYALNRQATEMNDTYFGYHRQSDRPGETASMSIMQRAKSNLSLYWIVPKVLFALPFLPLFILGLAISVRSVLKRKSISDAALLILLPYSVLIEALSYPIPRHHLFLVPLMVFLSFEAGVFLAQKLSPRSIPGQQKMMILMIAVLFALTVNGYITSTGENLMQKPAFAAARQTEYTLAQRLREKGASVIMSTYPGIAVWASADWQVLPQAPLPDILRFGRRKKVDYIILPVEKRLFFRVLDLRDSDIPRDLEDNLEFQVLEQGEFYDFVRVVKKEQ